MAKNKEKELGFEESLGALEKIVAQLESGDLPLERALEIFEEGIGLARRCQGQLVEAERKVEVLLRERGELKTVSFDSGSDAGAPAAETGSSQNLMETSVSVAGAGASGNAVITDDAIPF